jgi:hypothetical protein
MKCKVCDKEAVGDYCEGHESAYRNLVEKYEVWKRALGISWKEYLRDVAKNDYTGSWVKEVAEKLAETRGA